MILYVGTFVLVIIFLILSYQAGGASSVTKVTANTQSAPKTPANTAVDKVSIDQLSAANTVASLAEVVNLPVAGDLRESTTTLSIQKQLSQTDTEVIKKPQIAQPEVSTKRGIVAYTVATGDSLESIAQKFNISPQTLRWANSLSSDVVPVGKELAVPLHNGVVYTVRAGDTAETIASKYKVDSERLILYNDLDADQAMVEGTKILLPDGDLPETERPGYVAPAPAARSYMSYGSMGGSVMSKSYGYGGPTAGNRYASGNCTWYAYERRAQMGLPIGGMWGNAYSWASSARGAGFLVDKNPTPGAVIQTSSGGGGYGHVGVVERIEGDNIIISDMNYAGYNVVTWRVIPLSQAGGYLFIH